MVTKQSVSKAMTELRKYIPTQEDSEIVKEMLQDGLTPEQVLEALGHVGVKPQQSVLPESHQYAHEMTTEQKEREARAADQQPGEVVGGDSEGSAEGDDEEDMLSHVAGLLTSVTKRKKNKNNSLKNSVDSRSTR